MRTYGQFCPIAVGAEIFAERWTPLIFRELFSGSTRFNDQERGLPRIPPGDAGAAVAVTRSVWRDRTTNRGAVGERLLPDASGARSRRSGDRTWRLGQ